MNARKAAALSLAAVIIGGTLSIVTVLPAKAQQEPYTVGEQGVTSPKLIRKVDPQYTQEARNARIEGTVILQAVIGPSGTVEQLNLEQGVDPGLDKKAISAVKQWLFEPGRKDGQPVPVKTTIQIGFKLP